MRVYGVDFTSAPRRGKPIVVSVCEFENERLYLEGIDKLVDFEAFEAFLRRPGPWVGGFDFPFGLPRELVRDLGWPRDWRRLVGFCAALSRNEWRGILDGYRATRAVGSKYAHRATDRPAGSSSPMKLVNPPVALMFHEGAPRLLEAGVHLPGLAEGDRARIALEAYPGFFARKVLGRASYKSDTRSKHTAQRRHARLRVLNALQIETSPKLKSILLEDGSGDSLDATVCAVQAAWGWRRRRRNFGLPRRIESCEGWIVSA
jgi:hypothetical protein